MIVDSSAILAILFDEPDAASFAEALETATTARVSAGTYVELGIVVDARCNPILSRRLDTILQDMEVSIEPVTEHQARLAREAYRDYGKGSSHPAQLNFGDCFAYALARDRAEPVLFKGNDFSKTDIKSALA